MEEKGESLKKPSKSERMRLTGRVEALKGQNGEGNDKNTQTRKPEEKTQRVSIFKFTR